MGPETSPSSAGSRLANMPLSTRVTAYNLRAGVRHLLDALRAVLSSVGFLLVMTWMLFTRRLDVKVSGWTVLSSMARRGLKLYRLPARVWRRWRAGTTAQGSTT